MIIQLITTVAISVLAQVLKEYAKSSDAWPLLICRVFVT